MGSKSNILTKFWLNWLGMGSKSNILTKFWLNWPSILSLLKQNGYHIQIVYLLSYDNKLTVN
jgi:hypothetical protein